MNTPRFFKVMIATLTVAMAVASRAPLRARIIESGYV